MKTPQELAALAPLIEAALDLPDEGARRAWLAGLGPEHAEVVPVLERLLKQFESTAELDQGAPLTDLAGPAKDVQRFKPGVELGPYRLVREIGRGGMAWVWLALRSDGTGGPVALKLPAVSLDGAGFLSRFAREGAFLRMLEHPYIARLEDAGVTAEGQHYLALEYVEGQPLTDHCDGAALGLPARLVLFRQVLEAVQHAHAKGVLHRDLKPSNILVTAGGEVRLLDFGIAKVLVDGRAEETALTAEWGRPMTHDYASPEQRLGQPVSASSDVYALGVILHELACGQRPLPGGLPQERPLPSESCKADSAVARAEGGVRMLARRLGGDLDAIVLKALNEQPAARYADAGAMAADIDRVLAHEHARPLLERWRWQLMLLVRRYRSAVSVSTLLYLGIALLGHAHKTAAQLEAWLSPSTPAAQRVVLITIGPDDPHRLFHDARPADPETLRGLIVRILQGQPAVLGVDLDTSAPGFAALRSGWPDDSLRRVVWGRDMAASDRPGALPEPRPVLGSAASAQPVRAGLAVSVVDGSSSTLRWFRREVPTTEGPLASLPGEIVRGLHQQDDASPAALRSVRFAASDRLEFPASLVLAPGFDWRQRIQGRIVLLGGRYDGSDVHPTPLGMMHGVDVLAHEVETELGGHDYPRPEVPSVLLLGFVNLAAAIGCFGRFGTIRGTLATLGIGLGLAALLAALGWFPGWPYAVMVTMAALVNRWGAEWVRRRAWSFGGALRALRRRLSGRMAGTH